MVTTIIIADRTKKSRKIYKKPAGIPLRVQLHESLRRTAASFMLTGTSDGEAKRANSVYYRRLPLHTTYIKVMPDECESASLKWQNALEIAATKVQKSSANTFSAKLK